MYRYYNKQKWVSDLITARMIFYFEHHITNLTDDRPPAPNNNRYKIKQSPLLLTGHRHGMLRAMYKIASLKQPQ